MLYEVITVGIGVALLLALVATLLATNVLATLFVFLGAATYGWVYTVWLKRRTWLNIVIGGLSGSFAVLAGAARITSYNVCYTKLLRIGDDHDAGGAAWRLSRNNFV